MEISEASDKLFLQTTYTEHLRASVPFSMGCRNTSTVHLSEVAELAFAARVSISSITSIRREYTASSRITSNRIGIFNRGHFHGLQYESDHFIQHARPDKRKFYYASCPGYKDWALGSRNKSVTCNQLVVTQCMVRCRSTKTVGRLGLPAA